MTNLKLGLLMTNTTFVRTSFYLCCFVILGPWDFVRESVTPGHFDKAVGVPQPIPLYTG